MSLICMQRDSIKKDKAPSQTFFPVKEEPYNKKNLSRNNFLPSKIQFKGRIVSILKRKKVTGHKTKYYLFDTSNKKYVSNLYIIQGKYLFDDKKNSYELDIKSGQVREIPFQEYRKKVILLIS